MKKLIFITCSTIIFWVSACQSSSDNEVVEGYKSFGTNSIKKSNAQSVTAPPLNVQKLAEVGNPNMQRNPEHGQPGHRCDIPVGSLLNGEPAPAQANTGNNAAASPSASPSVNAAASIPVNSNANAAGAKTAPGMNPAHGQPGHRCDIPVGSPLNAPSAKATTPQTPPGMNPAHGQPGHRCDIAVGAPLNSKPTKAAIPPVK